MNFNRLTTVIKRYLIVSISTLFFIGCNDEKSANNSTPATTEINADTTIKTGSQPVVAKKRYGKVSTSMAADDTKVKMKKDKMGYYNRTEVLPAYDGGQTEMENYIINTIEYPQEAIDNNIEGIVTV